MEKTPEAFRTISEAAELLDLPQHVLRFWETRFPQLKPMKRGGGRRYYRPSDIDFLKAIQCLLYEKGYTIKGVRRLLKENGVAFVTSLNPDDKEQTELLLQKKQKNTAEELFLDDIVAERDEKLAGHGFFSFLRGENESANENTDVKQQNKAQIVQQVLLDLMECKRLLDRARQEG